MRVFSLKIGNDKVGTGSWEQIGQDIIGEANSDEFGWPVSLSDDEKTLAVGAQGPDGNNRFNLGHVRFYQTDADSKSSWKQLGGDIDGEAAGDNSGKSVSLSVDGNTVAIGSPYNDDNGISSGHVRVLVLG